MVYDGSSSTSLPSCTGFWHLATRQPAGRITFYRDQEAVFREEHG